MADDVEEKRGEKTSEKASVLSSLPFSQNDKDVIERQLNVTCVKTSSLDSIIDVYDIEKTAEVIEKHGYKNIALQFPDALLPDSSTIANLLEQKTRQKVYVLADTSYGSCCIDEVTAEHIKADVIVHYGRACLSPTRRLPVYYVFGKFSIDVAKCIEHFKQLVEDKQTKVVLMYDVVYAHSIEYLHQQLQSHYRNLIVTQIESTSNIISAVVELNHNLQQNMDEKREINGNIFKRFGFEFTLPSGDVIDDYQVFYIGQQSLHLTNLIMNYNKCQFITYDPETNKARKETLNVNRALMKRYYMIQKAKDAQVVGIAIGTLGVADYLDVIERLKKVLSIAGKKYYTFVMGKLNVPKMANFMEIDVFVLVACPENTMIDSQEFYKPIVTPYEMEIACLRTQEWTGEYITDFRQLLPGASHSVDLNDKENLDEDSPPEISLITGEMRPNYRTKDEEQSSTSLVERNQEAAISTQHHINAAEFLATRSWRGLEQNLGETAVCQAKEGRMGIASGYTNEKSDS